MAIDWQPVASAPRDQLLLLWVHGPFLGRWIGEEGGRWVDQSGAVELSPVRFWAEMNAPDDPESPDGRGYPRRPGW